MGVEEGCNSMHETQTSAIFKYKFECHPTNIDASIVVVRFVYVILNIKCTDTHLPPENMRMHDKNC